MKSAEITRSWKRSQIYLMGAWSLVMLAAVLAYMPGLDGPFLLDDFGSIKPLGDMGGIKDWESFKAFVFGGHAGPTGRPVSLLSFLIDANNWPTDSWPFKRTNLVIHLINGLLLGVLVSQILLCVDIRGRENHMIALVTAAIWLLHPFLVSTTLYIVQRMAQLSTLFMFAGLIMYLRGRMRMADDPRRAYLVMSAAVGIFTLLAMLSKENGILLPVLVGVIELTVVASRPERFPALNRYWGAVFIVLPAIVISLYLGKIVLRENFFTIALNRDFSLYERLLTQGRVLVDYLLQWFIPKLYTTGIFQDHFIKSTGLFSPISTALSYVFHIGIIAVALARRRQLPLFSLAVLFFYANHLLESTVVNLELYFEHRNYISAALLFLPVVELIHRKASFRGFAFASVSAILLVGVFTRYSATVWQSLPTMIEVSALKAPTSARAQGQFAKLLFISGRVDEAIAVVDRGIEVMPHDDSLLLTSKMYFLCAVNRLESDEFESLSNRLSMLPFDSRSLKAYNIFSQVVVNDNCPNITPNMLEAVYLKMLEVPANADPNSLRYSHVQFLIGYARTYAQRPVEALEAFENSLNARPGASHVMAMAALLATNGFNREALVLADRALAQLRTELADTTRVPPKVRESDILEFRETVRADLAVQQDAGNPDPGE